MHLDAEVCSYWRAPPCGTAPLFGEAAQHSESMAQFHKAQCVTDHAPYARLMLVFLLLLLCVMVKVSCRPCTISSQSRTIDLSSCFITTRRQFGLRNGSIDRSYVIAIVLCMAGMYREPRADPWQATADEN